MLRRRPGPDAPAVNVCTMPHMFDFRWTSLSRHITKPVLSYPRGLSRKSKCDKDMADCYLGGHPVAWIVLL